MSRDLAQSELAALFAQHADECFLRLLTIDHEDLGSPIRLVDNHEDIVSRGDTFAAFPFEFPPPQEREGELPRVSVIIDNVSQLLVQTLRQDTQSAPTITIELIAASAPDDVMAGPWSFEMRRVTHNVDTIRADLFFEPFLEEPYPVGDFTPSQFPGLFNASAS